MLLFKMHLKVSKHEIILSHKKRFSWDVSFLWGYLISLYVSTILTWQKNIKINANLDLAPDIALLLLACELTDI